MNLNQIVRWSFHDMDGISTYHHITPCFWSRQDVVFTSSPDTTIRIWIVANASCTQTINAHDAPVTGLSLHATGDYLLSCSEDKHWAFSDIATGRVLTKVADESVSSGELKTFLFFTLKSSSDSVILSVKWLVKRLRQYFSKVVIFQIQPAQDLSIRPVTETLSHSLTYIGYAGPEAFGLGTLPAYPEHWPISVRIWICLRAIYSNHIVKLEISKKTKRKYIYC